MRIRDIDAYMIFDSRGVPTIESQVTLESGHIGIGTVPSGASTGQYEAHELRDCNPEYYLGKSVDRAIASVRQTISPALMGVDVDNQEAVDRRMIELDGTPTRSHLGANAILSVSMAVARAAASARGLPLFAHLGDGDLLPVPEIQILGGGAHADWRTDVQDYLVIAVGAATYDDSLRMIHDVYHAAADLIRSRNGVLGVADEGGFWPDVVTNEQGVVFVIDAIKHAGYEPGSDVALSLDIASSDLFDAGVGKYRLNLEDRELDPDAFADLIAGWCEKYPIVSVEDPLVDDDFEGWAKLNKRIGHRVQLVGDDLFTTNPQRISRGIEMNAANAVLIKPNQIGTVTETIEAIRMTQSAGWAPLISARSGETEDPFISHLAVATNAGQIKVGSFARSERMVKWNEVLRIARQLGTRARFNSFPSGSMASSRT